MCAGLRGASSIGHGNCENLSRARAADISVSGGGAASPAHPAAYLLHAPGMPLRTRPFASHRTCCDMYNPRKISRKSSDSNHAALAVDASARCVSAVHWNVRTFLFFSFRAALLLFPVAVAEEDGVCGNGGDFQGQRVCAGDKGDKLKAVEL
ncbi:hypothetical protein FA95DRAFT_1556343 [Auriscalpium vulgare]|uniref:Uncharacterized protein n=1 Tax=Auriscalpium vulgare TaxID=40419 RepID=A0ACB8S0G5_9AGAM|nr:hypothetical protein FA95DRAFT_1556343 [Auriscalpium vulgare]